MNEEYFKSVNEYEIFWSPLKNANSAIAFAAFFFAAVCHMACHCYLGCNPNKEGTDKNVENYDDKNAEKDDEQAPKKDETRLINPSNQSDEAEIGFFSSRVWSKIQTCRCVSSTGCSTCTKYKNQCWLFLYLLVFGLTFIFESYGLLVVSFYVLIHIRRDLTSLETRCVVKEQQQQYTDNLYVVATVLYRTLAAILLNFIIIKEGRHKFNIEHDIGLYAAQITGFVLALYIICDKPCKNINELNQRAKLTFYSLTLACVISLGVGACFFAYVDTPLKQVEYHAKYTFEVYNTAYKSHNKSISDEEISLVTELLNKHPENTKMFKLFVSFSVAIVAFQRFDLVLKEMCGVCNGVNGEGVIKRAPQNPKNRINIKYMRV
jgi:hypothetical protein